MKPNCKTISMHLSDYIDGIAPSDLAWKIEMHIATCPDCAELARSLRQTVSLLGQVQPRQLSSDFDAKLAARIAAVQQTRPAVRRNAVQRYIDSMVSQLNSSGNNLRLRLGVGVAAFSLIVVGIVGPHAFMTSQTSNQVAPLIASSANSSDRDDLAFVAACANEQNQSNGSQTISDPAAQTLAARFDDASSATPSAFAAASPAQD